ncbi:hypothetical protein ACLB2K_044171 [Fragaria x ananassa]
MPDDMDELIPEIPIGEEHVEKFMQELYKVMTTPAGSDTSVEHPSWTAAGYAATGWESESCGAAVSDSASSVMAGVEYAGKLVAAAPGSGGRCGCKCGSNGGCCWERRGRRDQRLQRVWGRGRSESGR